MRSISAERLDCLTRLGGLILAVDLPHPVRVAVDGPDAAGKTILADELAEVLAPSGRSIVRASIDGFHRHRAERTARGSESPEGYFLDSFDYATLRACLLDPMGPGGNRMIRRRAFDYRTDSPVDAPTEAVDSTAILLFDGVFLLRRELRGCWDLNVFVDVPFEETQRRALARDRELFGSDEETARRYANRYVPGQRLYFESERPLDAADVVVRNSDPARPALEFRSR